MIRYVLTFSLCALITSIASAAVVYTIPNPVKTLTQNIGTSTSTQNYLYIDVDKDYVDDYNFRINYTSANTYQAYMWSETQIGLSFNQLTASNSSGYIGAVSSGTLISPSSSRMNATSNSLLADASQSTLINQGDFIVGMQFLRMGTYHFGWVRLNLTMQAGSNITIKVIDYAYESTPYTAIIAGNTGTLPLTLNSFTAAKNREVTSLKWSVSNAENVSHFVLEQSTDGISYSNLTTILFTSATEYKYDVNASKVTAYYRLKIMDKDGSYRYSDVIKVAGSQESKMNIFPNPAQKVITLKVEADKVTPYQLLITSAEGKIVHKLTSVLNLGENLIQLNINYYQPGYYTIQLISEGTIKTTAFLKQ
jgi:hypothetical protein